MQPHEANLSRPDFGGPGLQTFGTVTLPERLVVSGYRCWLTGYATGDIACWEVAWNLYARTLGPEHAGPAVTALATWVRTLRRHTARPLDRLPFGCSRLCPDETTGLRLIAACQHRSRCLARAAAFELTSQQSSCLIDDVVGVADGFADALTKCGQQVQRPAEMAAHIT